MTPVLYLLTPILTLGPATAGPAVFLKPRGLPVRPSEELAVVIEDGRGVKKPVRDPLSKKPPILFSDHPLSKKPPILLSDHPLSKKPPILLSDHSLQSFDFVEAPAATSKYQEIALPKRPKLSKVGMSSTSR